jgi:hypothetical protein
VFAELDDVGEVGDVTGLSEKFLGDAAGDDASAEGYVDMGEVWGYDEAGRLRTIREEEPAETTGAPETLRTEAPTPRRKRVESSGERKKHAQTPRSTKKASTSNRKADKRRGSRA